MRRHLAIAAAAALGLPAALANMQFINPPAYGGPIPASKYPVRYIGDTLDINWTAGIPGKKLSVVLYQLTAADAASFTGQFSSSLGQVFDFITHDQVNATEFNWTVTTTKNLAISNIFSIAVWQEGAQITDSATGLFIISTPLLSTTSSTTSSSTATTATTTSTSTSTSTPPPSKTGGALDSSASPSSSPESSSQSSSSGLSSGAAAGLGVGVSFAVILGVATGWFFGRRRRRSLESGASPVSELPISMPPPPPPDKHVYYQPSPSEFHTESPAIEMPSDRRYELS